MNFAHTQKGMGVTGIVFVVIALGLLLKLGVAIAPAQISNYQLKKLIAKELYKANQTKESPVAFMQSLENQMAINSNYTTDLKQVMVLTNKTPGSLAAKTNYSVESQFFGSIYIVNRFADNITANQASY